jgi:hypothetical protein
MDWEHGSSSKPPADKLKALSSNTSTAKKINK